jgi:hypothetical protein
MLETYQAVLRANQVEWSGDAPPQLAVNEAVRVHITLLDKVDGPPAAATQGARMAAALERLAASRSLAGIADAAEWEREQRKDRALPGRDV